MNVTEFAEQIVFGKTLEDKLQPPGKLCIDPDRHSRAPLGILATPGRPLDLKFRQGPGSLQTPSDDKLENEQSRGQLLHFLANHELLATELMALVLLKFPDAPHAFRQGVLVTLQEEQEHTRMYMRRMKECGVEFGQYPVSGQFWKMIEPMRSPMDFVSQLSLTFEQANLDYSLHFASVFERIGDNETAKVLRQIYEDEIGHVQHGLHWFRQWKRPEQSDWAAYEEALEFPMSPQRARGPRAAFNREGRLKAGLTEDFIDAAEVYRQSRGRTPVIHWFAPAAEAQLAHQGCERETPLMEQLAKDLELVMVPMSKQDDVVLVRRIPSQPIRKQMIDKGLELPQFVPFSDRSELQPRKLNQFSPWAWTENAHHSIKDLVDSAQIPPTPWSDASIELFRKSWGVTRLRKWLMQNESAGTERVEWFTCSDTAGVIVDTIEQIPELLGALGNGGHANAIFKVDLSASGRGQRRLRCDQPLTQQDNAWLQATLGGTETAGSILGIVEPQLDRLVDISFLWHIPADAAETEDMNYLGWTRPLVTAGRKYVGTQLGNPLGDCEPEVKRFLLSDQAAKLQSTADWLEAQLQPELKSRQFTGYLGVDAFVCRDRSGDLKIKPLVELNPRMTMGHVARRLGRSVSTGVQSHFRILTKDQWRKYGPVLDEIPFQKTRDGRWKSGVLWLGEVDQHTKLVPALLIGKEALKLAEAKEAEGSNV